MMVIMKVTMEIETMITIVVRMSVMDNGEMLQLLVRCLRASMNVGTCALCVCVCLRTPVCVCLYKTIKESSFDTC